MPSTNASIFLALLLSIAPSLDVHATGAEPPDTIYVDGDKATVIGFLPPSMNNPRDGDAREAHELVARAIANAKLCLGEDYANYRVVFAEHAVVRSHGHEQPLELGTVRSLVGALLVGPESPNARVLFAGGGPEALSRMLDPAATEYFGRECSR
jgi:hypothetical protein